MVRSDIVKMYKDVHTWVGIISGLALFIAFYAGAITMFEGPLKRWASPPPSLPAPVSLEKTPDLIAKTLSENPDAAKGYTIHLETGSDVPARMSWTVWPEGRYRGAPTETWYSALTDTNDLVVEKDATSPVAQLVDTLHQQVGLPLPHEPAMWIMGTISLLYFVALVSGVIVFLPGLTKDLFALRMGRNLKRMWLDIHNVLGIFSLPFHIIMALTAIVFAFHDQIYDTQNNASYNGQLRQMFEANEPVHHVDYHEGMALLAPGELADRLESQVSGLNVRSISYMFRPGNELETMVNVERPGFNHRAPDYGMVAVNPLTGDIMSAEYLPGHQPAFVGTVTSFFALHFGNFGGAPIRWAYVALGLSGAFLFYSGNLLWLESRRNKARKSQPARAQPLKTRILGPLTLGVSLGSVAGISLTVASAKLMTGHVADLNAAHNWIYYLVFCAMLVWAFMRGMARGAVELQYAVIIAMLCIPGVSLISAIIPNIGWNHGGSTLLVDGVALIGALVFAYTAHKTRQHADKAAEDSVWFRPERTNVLLPAE